MQVFLFAENQFAALTGLVVDLVMWGAIRIAIEQERLRESATSEVTNAADRPEVSSATTD